MKKKNKIRFKNLSIQLVAILVINVLVVLSFLQLSSVQTYFGRLLTENISKKTGFEIVIGKVDIVWLDNVKLEDVEIKDLASNDLIIVKNLHVNYNIGAIMANRRILIDKVVLDQATVNLTLSNEVPLNITSFISSLKKIYAKSNSGKSKPIFISSIELNNGKFSYNQLSKDSLSKRFDYNHFGFDSINLQITRLAIIADTISLQINRLSALETSTSLPIKSLKSYFEVSNSRMKFNKLSLELGSSIIEDSMVFSYAKMADLSHFIKKVHIDAHFDKLKLASSDLAYFAPYFNDKIDTIYFTGNLKGKIDDFSSTNFKLRFGDSKLNGNAYFQGLPDTYNTFMDIKFSKSTLFKKDLSVYIPAKDFNKYYPIDLATVNGSFIGYPKDFVAKASFKTSIGFAHTDLNLKLNADPAKSSYSGSIKLVNFNMGKLTESSSMLGLVTLTGKIKGKGMTKSSANFVLESNIDRIDIADYSYSNIKTNAHFSQELFDGSLNIDDPNLKFKTSGIIDFRNNTNLVQLEGLLEYAQLDALKLRKDPSSISASCNVDVKGISLDSIVGKIVIPRLEATNNENSYQVNNLELISEIKNNERLLVLFSDRVKFQLRGNFNLTTAFKDFNAIWQEHKFRMRNQSMEIQPFYKNIKKPEGSSDIEFDLELHDINPLLNLFDPLIYLSSNSKITGRLTTGELTKLDILFKSDSIIYNHNTLINNELKLSTETEFNNKYFISKLNAFSDKQFLRSGASLDSLVINTYWVDDSLNFELYLQQQTEKNINSIQGTLNFGSDTTLLSIYKSQIQVLDQTWKFNKSNSITFTKNNILLTNMGISSKNQSIYGSGSITKNDNTPIIINADNVQMENLNPLITNKLKGTLNGQASISNLFTTPLIESSIKIDSFQVDETYFGNIDGTSNWNRTDQLFDVLFFVERNKNRLVNVTGTYKPLGDKEALNLNARFIDTELKLAEPFTKGLFSSFEGTLSGDIAITGALFEPKLNGSGDVSNAALTIDYLSSKLLFEGDWALDSNAISLNNIAIRDQNKGKGNLKAVFNHTNYKSFMMDIQADYSNLQLLSTTSKDNDYFYGTAVGSGTLAITGPMSNLTIDARAKTEKGTKLYIPLTSNKSGAKQEDFISFSNFTRETSEVKVEVEEKVNLKNLTINLDLEITPEAYAEIIFDLTAGDIIRGNGKGNLSLGIDTKGKFTMLGEYEFTEGAYNFTMYNIVNKEFKINPKSKIIWSGDPYLANMDIDAVYKVNTSLAPIIDTVYQNLPEVKRIYPSKVLLDLDGPLLSPDIAFDITIEDYPRSNVNIDTEVRAFLNKIHNDEQEMNRQVFSLLVFRKYSPPNSFSTGGTVGSSVSEFVSNQLSYWISQVDENLTIDFDLGNLDENALETFQLRVSYAFMDGKLIITRDGGFTDQNQNATLSSITGDWTVEYLLSDDGKLRIKLFKKTNYDQLSSSSGANDELISGGFSLLFTTSFDSIKELFNKNKPKKSKQSNTSPPSNEAIKPEDEENIP